jgi:Phytanoyl-CoA dioxygenase (PhyH)
MENQATVATKPFPLVQTRKALGFEPAIGWLGKLTNNDYSSRLLNRKFIRAYRNLEIPRLDEAGARVVDDLGANGIAFGHIDEFFAPGTLDELKKAFDKYHEDFRAKGPPKNRGKSVYIHTIHKAHTFLPNDIVSAFLGSPTFATIAARYLEMVPRYVGTSFWHTLPAPADDRIYSQQWHRDYNDRQILKVFLYLNDVGELNGPFEYLTSSHLRGELGSRYDKIGSNGYRAYPDSAEIKAVTDSIPHYKLHELPPEAITADRAPWRNEPSTVLCTAPAGTLIFGDTFAVHRGGHVEQGHRNLMMLTFSTNANVHKPHFSVTREFAETLSPFMRMVFGLPGSR